MSIRLFISSSSQKTLVLKSDVDLGKSITFIVNAKCILLLNEMERAMYQCILIQLKKKRIALMSKDV